MLGAPQGFVGVAGMTQHRVMVGIGVTITTVTNWERWTYEPRGPQLLALGLLFGVCLEGIDTQPASANAAR